MLRQGDKATVVLNGSTFDHAMSDVCAGCPLWAQATGMFKLPCAYLTGLARVALTIGGGCTPKQKKVACQYQASMTPQTR